MDLGQRRRREIGAFATSFQHIPPGAEVVQGYVVLRQGFQAALEDAVER